MGIKEKKLVLIIIIFLSLFINFFLIINIGNYALFSLFINNSIFMHSFRNSNFDEIDKCFASSVDIGEFITEQKEIISTIGKIKKCKIGNILDNFKYDNGTISIQYDFKSSKYSNVWNTSILKLKLEKRQWLVCSNSVFVNGVMINSKKSMKEQSLSDNELLSANKIKAEHFAKGVLESYIRKDYQSIYSRFSETLKGKGDEVQFVKYLEFTRKGTGDITVKGSPTLDVDDKGREYKITYPVFSQKYNNQIEVIIWVIEQNCVFNLSGIKFIKGKW